MKNNRFLKRLKLALKHVVHGIVPFFYKKAVHSIDDGDPTLKQKRMLYRLDEGYLSHLLLNIFLAVNHFKGDKNDSKRT